MPCFARVSGVMVICSENADCGKSEQNSMLLLPVSSKIGSKREKVTTKDFNLQTILPQFF